MRHLKSLTIGAFRGLRDVRLEGLGSVNVLVGENNSGKTSVLEAIALLANWRSSRQWLTIARSRQIRSAIFPNEPLVESLSWLFPKEIFDTHALPETIEIDAIISGDRVSALIELRQIETIWDDASIDEFKKKYRNRSAFNVDFNEPRRGYELRFKPDKNPSNEDVLLLWENEPLRPLIREKKPLFEVVILTPVSHRTEPYLLRDLSKAKEDNLAHEVVEMIKILDPDIEDIEIVTDNRGHEPLLKLRHRRYGLTPISNFGDGLRRALSYALSVLASTNGVLLIDEIETAIHKNAQPLIFKWLKTICSRQKVQIICTTHSLEALDALLASELDTPDEIVAFKLERTDNNIIPNRIRGELLREMRYDFGMDVR